MPKSSKLMKTSRTINNYEYNNELYNVNDIIAFIDSKFKVVPSTLSTRQATKFYDQFHDFIVKVNILHYDGKKYVEDSQIQDILSGVYNDPVKGYGRGLNSFHAYINANYINITRDQSREFLKSQQSYQLSKPISRQNIKVQKASVEQGIWYLDLIDMNYQKKGNKGYRYIMTVLDSYSRQVILLRLKTKTKEEVFDTITGIMKYMNVYPKQLISDQGSEFKTKIMVDFAKEKKIRLTYQASYTPQANIEQQNATVRKILQQTFIKNKNLIWYDQLQNVSDVINESVRNTYTPPTEKVINEHDTIVQSIGDMCRVKTSVFSSNIRKLNKSGYGKYIPIKWTVQLFLVSKVIEYKTANSLPRYELKTKVGKNPVLDDNDKPTRFNHTDLQFIDKSLNNNLNNKDEARLNNTNEIIDELDDDNVENIIIKKEVEKEPRKTRSNKTPNEVPHFVKLRLRKAIKASKAVKKDIEEVKFIIDRLIGKKTHKKKVFYKVVWQGYPIEDATWEPKNKLIEDGFQDMIDSY